MKNQFLLTYRWVQNFAKTAKWARIRRELRENRKIEAFWPTEFYIKCIIDSDRYAIRPPTPAVDKYEKQDGIKYDQKHRLLLGVGTVP